MATITDVAAAAGVSKATVSRVLSGRALAIVAPETAARVRRAAEELGYQANPVAAALATGRTGIVALWMRKLHQAFFASMIQHASESVRAAGYELIVEHGHAEFARPSFRPHRPQFPVDGLIAHEPPGVEGMEQGADWPDVPVVAITERRCEGIDTVRIDLLAGAQQAMDHLLDRGRRRIAYLGGPTYEGHPVLDRERAYLSALRRIGEEPWHVATTGDHYRGGHEAALELLRAPQVPDAIFCHNDEVALGAVRAALDLGMRVPEDVAIVGCDDIEAGQYSEPPITTIHVPVEAVMEHAWRLLSRRIEDPQRPVTTIQVPTRLIVRRSS